VEPAVLQTGAETFRVLLGDGEVVEAILATTTRRALAPGRPPLQVAQEIVRLGLETGSWPAGVDGPVDLGQVAGGTPTGVEELRHRLG
jgi:hypothetical protein